jgi:Zn-finger nucleic acid-binding protein
MTAVNFQDAQVERCDGCGGIFLESKEVTRLKAVKGSEAIDIGNAVAARKWNKVEDINCPRCEVPMEKSTDVDQHHIWYEKCPNCNGLFFDAGEFRDFKKYTLVDYMKGLFVKGRKP